MKDVNWIRFHDVIQFAYRILEYPVTAEYFAKYDYWPYFMQFDLLNEIKAVENKLESVIKTIEKHSQDHR